jgi:ribokinase
MPETPSFRPPRVLVIGSSNTDLVVASPRLPKPGETLLGGEFRCMSGGKGANQAVAAARAGAKVSFIGARGDDDFGRQAEASLRREKIDLAHFLVRKKMTSGVALILVGGRAAENMISVARSANDTLSRRDIVAARAEFRKARVVIAQLEIPLEAVVAAAEEARREGVPFLLNPAPARRLPRGLWKHVHLLTPNEHEAALLTGESDLKKAAHKLLKLGCQNVVITLGARGALLVTADGSRHFSAPRVKAVDTVGAGDCFTAWLGVGLAEGLPLEASIRRALQAATLSVMRVGAQASLPRRREVIAKFR